MQKKLVLGALSAAMILGLSPVSKADANNIMRVSGADRYVTSMRAQGYLNSKTVIFASGQLPQDSLSAINLCTAFEGKLVLVNGTEDMSDFVKNSKFEKIYIVGGVNTIGEDFEAKLKSTSVPIERISGADRFATNNETLKKSEYNKVALANSDDYSIALSSTRMYKEKKLGLLLADKTNYDSVAKDYEVEYVLGNSTQMPYDKGTRIEGPNKFETSVKVADLLSEPESIALVSGNSFADALSAINVSLGMDADIFVVPDGKIEGYNGLSEDLAKKNTYILGGPNTLSDKMVDYTITGKMAETKYEVLAKNGNLGLVKTSDGKYYVKNLKTGTNVSYDSVKNGLFKLDFEHAYMLNKDNTVKIGQFDKDGNTYLATPEYGLRRGWKYMNNALYYFSPYDYRMYKDGVKATGDGVYWFGKDGKLRIGNKKSGVRGINIKYYGPTKEELTNKWLKVENPEARFKAQEVVNYATKFDGLPFKWFGTELEDGTGVYCCGGVYSAFKHFGVHIPGPDDCDMKADQGYRMVQAQYVDAPKFGGKYVPVNFSKLYPGDAIYSNRLPRKFNHAALYMGLNGGRPILIHASLNNGWMAEPSPVESVWGQKYINAVRFIN